jgi:hypothetical protein
VTWCAGGLATGQPTRGAGRAAAAAHPSTRPAHTSKARSLMQQPANPTTPNGAASLLVAALEHTWQTIRTRHPDVPDAVLVVASGAEGKRLHLGHFAPHRWQVNGADRHEVLVGGEGLQRGPLEVLGTLLHEAAHGLAQARGIQDTSRQGRYHNRRYATLAGELGLEVASVQPIGWSATPVPREHRQGLRRPARGPGRGPGPLAPPGPPPRLRAAVPQPARRQLRLWPPHPGRQDHPRRGVDPLRRLPAALRARRPR